MKRALRDKVLRIEFVSYYAFMTFFSAFLTYFSIELRFTHLLFPILSMTACFLSAIILYNYYFKSAERVKNLILPYIFLIGALFITSTIVETIIYGFHWYVLIMKVSMYFLAVLIPITQYAHISHKISQYRDELKWNK